MADTLSADRQQHRRRRRRIRRIGVRIDMTPMVDVAFLLLTFFMLTTAFRRPQTMEIGIPEEKSERTGVQVEESNILQIRVDRHNQLYWNLAGSRPVRAGRDALRRVFHDRSATNIDQASGASIRERYKLIVLIKIDSRAEYENMIEIIDELDLAVASLNKHYGLKDVDERLSPRFAFAPFTAKDEEELAVIR